MKNKAYRFTIEGIALDEGSAGAFVILRSNEAESSLPIPIGPSEAGSLILEIEHIEAEHKGTHDLVDALLKRHRFSVEALYMDGYCNGCFEAKLHYRKGLRRYTQRISPSDGLVMSAKTSSPIYIDRKAVAEAEADNHLVSQLQHNSEAMLLLGSEFSSAGMA